MVLQPHNSKLTKNSCRILQQQYSYGPVTTQQQAHKELLQDLRYNYGLATTQQQAHKELLQDLTPNVFKLIK
jgi:hypothetical protein